MAATARRCEGKGARDTAAHTPASAGAELRPVGSRPEPLGLEGSVESVQSQLGAGFADVGQVGIEDGGVEGLVPQIGADLAQGNAFLQEVGGVAVAQGVRGGTGVDAAGGPSQAAGALDTALAHGAGAEVHGLAQGESAVGPAPARGGKEQGGVLVRPPPDP